MSRLSVLSLVTLAVIVGGTVGLVTASSPHKTPPPAEDKALSLYRMPPRLPGYHRIRDLPALPSPGSVSSEVGSAEASYEGTEESGAALTEEPYVPSGESNSAGSSGSGSTGHSHEITLEP
jgi:hypothetical protein